MGSKQGTPPRFDLFDLPVNAVGEIFWKPTPDLLHVPNYSDILMFRAETKRITGTVQRISRLLKTSTASSIRRRV